MSDVLLAARPLAPVVHPESRAFEIAERGRAKVHVLTVLDAGTGGPERRAVELDLQTRRGKARLGEVVTAEGKPWKCILEEADRRACQLIVIGPSSGESDVEETLFGATAERLAHRARQPVLMVRRPADRPYEHVLATTDFSRGSRTALLAAAALLPDARITLLHAYRVPFEGFLTAQSNVEEIAGLAEMSMAEFLGAGDWPSGLLERTQPVLLEGELEEVIERRSREDPFDVVVVGSHGQTGLLEKVLGGTAERLLKTLRRDLVLVREA